MANIATASHAAPGGHGHGHGPASRLHEELPHHSEFQIKHPPTWFFHATFGMLLFLLAVTVGLYYVDLSKFIPIPGINLIVALIVAVIKATFVVYFFMNIRGSTKLTVFWAVLGFIWLLLMGGVFLDYRTRPATPGWQQMEYPTVNGQPNMMTEKGMAPAEH